MSASPRRPLPFGHEIHLRAHQFLVDEAYLLDEARWEDWFALLDPRVAYRMPVRVTALKAVDESSVQTMDHFAEDHYALRKRVERFATSHAWTEDPRSRTRHHLTNVRTFAPDHPSDAFAVVESALLLFRSRGDRDEPSIVSAGRRDVLVESDGDLRLLERLITVDESVLRTQNLAIFL